MTNQYNEFTEKAKHLEIAMKYTGGDLNKAKAMVSGNYFDTVIMKTKFFAPGVGHSGLFIASFNTADEYISDISAVISLNRDIYENTRVFDEWKLIYNDLKASREIGTSVDAEALCDFLVDSFIEHDVFPDVKDGNIDNLTRTVRYILERSFNGKIQVQLETEPATSLQLELAGIKIDSPEHKEVRQLYEHSNDEEEDGPVLTPEEERMNIIEAEAKYVIEGKIIVAPVKGKYINDVAVGENIKILLSSKDPVSVKILRVLNAIDEEKNIYAIKGRIKEKIPYSGGGYVIYALVAKGVLAKIIEEENVKIQLDQPLEDKSEKEKGEGKYVLIMAVFGALIIILTIILFRLS